MSETSSVQQARGRRVKAREVTVSRLGPGSEDAGWERARLIPVSGITGPDEEERRGSSALLAVLESVKEFGRALTVPLGAPAGVISTYIEVSFKLGEKHLRPDGLIRVVRGSKSWTALVEVKTGRNVLRADQIESYLDLARQQGFDAVLTISNQLVSVPGEHPVILDGRRLRKVSLHHMSWSQVYTEALIEQGNQSVTDPDQAWILAEFARYLGHPRSGAVDFDDMGSSWVAVRDAARAGTLTQNDKGATEVVNRFGQLMSFAAMRLSRQLGVDVVPVLSAVEAKDPGHRLQSAVVTFAETGRLHGALRVPHAVAPIEITADVRAGQVRCAVTVAAPRVGRPSTRVNWLVRQLREAPGDLCIEPITAWQRTKASAKRIAQIRDDPKVLVDDPKRELRAFTVSLAANIGTRRGQGHGSFVSSVVSAIDHFYAEAVQHVKPWTQTPPKVRDDEPSQDHQAISANAAASEEQDIRAENTNELRPESALAPTPE
jgi:hypothetical protein